MTRRLSSATKESRNWSAVCFGQRLLQLLLPPLLRWPRRDRQVEVNLEVTMVHIKLKQKLSLEYYRWVPLSTRSNFT